MVCVIPRERFREAQPAEGPQPDVSFFAEALRVSRAPGRCAGKTEAWPRRQSLLRPHLLGGLGEPCCVTGSELQTLLAQASERLRGLQKLHPGHKERSKAALSSPSAAAESLLMPPPGVC